MKKIPTLFVRNPDNPKYVMPEVTPGCEWVTANEGVPTRKFDGVCVLVRNGAMFARQQVKEGGVPPADFEPVDFDEATGKTQGWVPVDRSPDYARHWEAWDERVAQSGLGPPPDGTYELCGEKVNGNPEGFEGHVLVPHGSVFFEDVVPLDFKGLGMFLRVNAPLEGIVWHHPDDGRMAKLKRRDFA